MKYEVKILEVGSMVQELMDMNDCLIIYNETIKDVDLREISAIHTVSELKCDVSVGDKITIGEESYTVTSIGDIAQKTLRELGHCTIKFDGESVVNLPGELHVRGNLPKIKTGDKILIK